MASKPSSRPYGGSVIVRKRKTDTFYSLRFSANGRRRSQKLGPAADGWTYRKAEEALQALMVDVRRGVWVAPEDVVVEAPVPTFHEFASECFERWKIEGGTRGNGLSEKGRADLEWRLKSHLLPWFADMKLDAIGVEEVDRFKLAKVRERKELADAAAKGKPIIDEYTDRRGRKYRGPRRSLSNTSINKLLATLGAVLEVAVEYGHIKANPAHGRRRRLPSVTPRRLWLDRAEHIETLLDAAGKLDEKARVRSGQRRALLATFVYGGLRIGEALALGWQDVNLADGKIVVRAAKSPAGVRTVYMLPVLRDELDRYPKPAYATPDTLVFGTSTGGRQGETNVRKRILEPAVELANEQMARAGAEPLPKVRPHDLRRTFCSLLFAIGDNPRRVMTQAGHKTANLTLSMYAQEMDRQPGESERLAALVNGGGGEWRAIGAREHVSVQAGRA
jgi:integrase